VGGIARIFTVSTEGSSLKTSQKGGETAKGEGGVEICGTILLN